MADPIKVSNSAAQLAGKELLTAEDEQVVSGPKSFERAPDAPFLVEEGSGLVAHLDADLLDGEHGDDFHNASLLATGTIPATRFPATLPPVSGENLTNLDASNLTGVLPATAFPATLPVVSGQNLTDLNASALASGTIPDARFPATLPAVSGLNLTGIEFPWQNMVGDPTMLCWPYGNAAAPAFYQLAGAGAAVERTGTGQADTSEAGLRGFGARLTSAAATAYLNQTLIGTTLFPTELRGRRVALGGWVKSSAADAARLRLYDGVGESLSPFHSGGGEWEWLTVTREVSGSGTHLQAALVVESGTKVAYVEGLTAWLGRTPPPRFVPTPTILSSVAIGGQVPSATGQKQVYPFATPAVLRQVWIETDAAVSGATLICDVNLWDGSAWQSAFSTRPQIAAAALRGVAVPDGTYRYRCAGFGHSPASVSGNLVSFDVDQAAGGGAARLMILSRWLQWARPQQQFLDMGE